MSRIAIIGTAGRKEDGDKLGSLAFSKMVDITKSLLSLKGHTLMSGGAAYADAIAVVLYLTGYCADLELYLPCEFDIENRCYVQESEYNSYDSGRTANYYHSLFTKKRGIDSLEEIARAIEKGAKVTVGHGFKDRNTMVAQADGIIALTFGNQRVVKDGGTEDCCDKYLARRGKHLIHIDLNDWSIHRDGTTSRFA